MHRRTRCSQRLELDPESVLVIRGDTLVTRDARLADDDDVEIRPVISGGAVSAVKCRRVQGAGGHRRPPPQRRVLRATASCTTAASRCAGRSTSTTCSRPASGCWSRCRAARTRSRSGTSCSTLGYEADGLYLGLGIGEYSDESGALRPRRSPTRAGCTLHRGRPAPTDYGYDIPTAAAATRRVAVRRVRAVEAPPVRLGRARARLRRRRHRPQPRRRGRGAARQRAALGDRLPRPPAPGAARRAPGFARKVKPLVRLGEREMAAYCVLQRHRLPGRGVPDGRGQPAPRVQGGAQRARGPLAGHEGRVPLRLPRARATSAFAADAERRARRPRGRAPCAARRRRASVCAFCRLRRSGRPTADRPVEPLERAERRREPRPFAAGEQVLLVDAKRRRHLVTPRRGRRVPHPRRRRRATTTSSASAEGATVRTTATARARRGAADARRVRARDAARRAGDLPEGPRADPDAGRHLPRRARARVGRRLGRADDGAAARGRPTGHVTGYELRDDFADRARRNVEGFLGADVPARRRGARRLRGHRRSTTSTASCSTCPSRGRW